MEFVRSSVVVLGERVYLVECFSPGVRRDDVESAAARAVVACEELRAHGVSVAYAGAILVPGDEVVLHLFNSESEDAVRAASERAALPLERILETVSFDGGHV